MRLRRHSKTASRACYATSPRMHARRLLQATPVAQVAPRAHTAPPPDAHSLLRTSIGAAAAPPPAVLAGPLFRYFCPLSTGGLPSSVAGALTNIYEIDGVTGVACFRTQTLCESTASTTCGSTNFGYSGVSCAVGSTSVCAYVSDTSAFSYYCPNMLGVAHLNSDVVQIDPVSLLPCYVSAQSCSFAASNLCTYVAKSRLANSSSAAQAAVCVDGSSTVCAFTSGDFTYYCPPAVHRVMPVFAQRDPISAISCYNTVRAGLRTALWLRLTQSWSAWRQAANCALAQGNPCVGPGVT